jgi:drug/metabolite transporter (DMT)-like permease
VNERRALAWAIAAIVLWGTLAAAVGDALKGVEATRLVLWALVFSAPTLLIIDVARGQSLAKIFRGNARLVALGIWGIFGYHAAFFVAVERAPIIEANLLNYLWPLFMVFLAPLARERLAPLDLAGAALGFGGAVLVVTQGKTLHLAPEHAVGYALAAVAALSWSSFSVLIRRLGAEAEGRMTLFVTASLAPALALALTTGTAAPPTGRALAAAAWLGIGPMGIAFWCWSRALALGTAARIGLLSYLDPLLSTLVVAAVLGKEITRASALGMALIVVGSAGPAVLRVSTKDPRTGTT